MKSTIRNFLLAGVAFAGLGMGTVSGAFAQDMPGEGVSIDMARATWDTGWWQAEVYSQLLGELGYDVKDPVTLDAPAFYTAVGTGDVDLWVNGWFPLHNTFTGAFEGSAELVGMTVKSGALSGYLIDKATADKYDIKTVSDITENDEVKALFDSNGDGKADMVACPPGWGCEVTIAHHMEAYGWEDDINLIKASYAAGMADALGRFQAGEPIFFYTWTPNWTVGVLKPGEDVVWLQVDEVNLPEEQQDLAEFATVANVEGCSSDPCVMGWPANDIRPVANSKFLEENPAAASLLESVQIPVGDIFAQNVQMNEGADSPEDLEEQATAWIEKNREQVDQWLKTAREAAAQ